MKSSLALAVALAVCVCGLAVAQSVPRTSQGRPDFQGVWATLWVSPLERPPGMQLVLTKDDAVAFAARGQPIPGTASATEETPFFGPELRAPLMVRGEYRSSIVIDPANGKMPYTEAGRRHAASLPPIKADGPEGRNYGERCINHHGPPIVPRVVGNFLQLVQTRDSVVIARDYTAELRIIPLDGRPPPMLVRSGLSTGRWDGDTLVVESTGFRDDEIVRGVVSGNFAIRRQTKIVERFTLISSDEIAYTFTVEDPVLYSQPWTGELVLTRQPGARIFEFACHEGNYSMAGILGGARAVERRAAAKAGKP